MSVINILKRFRYVFFTVAFLIIAVIIDANFLNPFNIIGLLMDITIIGMLSLGQALAMFTGGIDLSNGFLASMSTVVLAWIMTKTYDYIQGVPSIIICFLFVLICGAAVGFITGVSIAKFKLPPIIASLGTMWISRGFAFFVLRGVPTGYPEKGVSMISRTNIGAVPVVFLFFVLVVAIIYIFLTYTRGGRAVYAIGGNEYAARLSGIKVEKVLILVYVTAGILSAIGGIILGAYQNSSYARAASGYEMLTIAGVVMGGAAMSGGEGNIINCMLGVVIFRIINKLMVFANLSGYLEGTYMGIILLIVLFISNRSSKKYELSLSQK